ncbi:MAG: metabolite traffic protein EboE [Thiotrichales bacterium]|nr:metabolite traffic protein EboE [Thiotrichales bacterium]MCY4349870.1 metabolite traffic protein EboE [Thiotrichales bacterium]
MRLSEGLGWLTYCQNIHPTQTWAECRAALEGPTAAVKARICPDAAFAVGLRFSAETLHELAPGSPGRSELARILTTHDFRAVTMNGFPYGPFHGTAVKENAYRPDWTTPERLAYTCDLADLMAELAPPGEPLSLSTVPGTFKPWAAGREATMAANLIAAAAHLARIEAETGVRIALAIEPEPCCFLETIAEAVAFFRDHLLTDAAVRTVADAAGLSAGEAARAVPRHLGLCYDVCHAAVEYEDAAASVAALREAGIPVHKLQLSAALRVAPVHEVARRALAVYDEPVYLHQTVASAGGGLTRYADLAEPLSRGAVSDGEEWRVHFHVPIFVEDLGAFGTTQAFLREILAMHREAPISRHLEVETYTWDVLPRHLTEAGLEAAVARELGWVCERLT